MWLCTVQGREFELSQALCIPPLSAPEASDLDNTQAMNITRSQKSTASQAGKARGKVSVFLQFVAQRQHSALLCWT